MERLRRAFASVVRGDTAVSLPSDPMVARVKHQVELVAIAMRDERMDRLRAAATVGARVRLVLVDGGLAGLDAGLLVARASRWVDEIYRAA